MKPTIKIGYGYDVHQLTPQVDLWLGGIKIPHTHGAIGHSDADVLIHVICDALLGAANLGDIGFHFSDKDQKYKDIDSKILLKEVLKLIDKKISKLVILILQYAFKSLRLGLILKILKPLYPK